VDKEEERRREREREIHSRRAPAKCEDKISLITRRAEREGERVAAI